MKFFKIFLDAGHDGKDPGAINQMIRNLFGYIKESVYVLRIAKQLRKCFTSEKRKFKFSRRINKYVDLNKRWKMANDWGADLSLSIHLNSSDTKSVRGTEVYYWKDSDKGLAAAISKSLSKGLGITNRGAKKHAFARTQYPKSGLIHCSFKNIFQFNCFILKRQYPRVIMMGLCVCDG